MGENGVGLGMVIIDYLQLLRANDSRESRVEQVSQMSRGLKILARELNIPVIAVSQLSRAVESRPGARPQLSDLRECVTATRSSGWQDGSRKPIAELVGSNAQRAHRERKTTKSSLLRATKFGRSGAKKSSSSSLRLAGRSARPRSIECGPVRGWVENQRHRRR